MTANEDEGAQVRQAVAAVGGMTTSVAVMGLHLDDGAIQVSGCRGLAELAKSAGNRAPIVAAGGIAAVLRAMGAHPDNSRGRAMLAVCWLSSHSQRRTWNPL